MQPEDLPGTDANTLPYFITEAQTGHRVPAHFEPLTPNDAAELNNEDWATAQFSSTWKQYVQAERVYKLVRVDFEDQRIQGLAHVGKIEQGSIYLKKSLLEAAPFNQHGNKFQVYRGVGRVLIARLVAESVLLGGQGRVSVRPRTGVENFYQAMGFEPVLPLKRNYALNAEEAAALLNAACSMRRQHLEGD